MKKMRKVYTWKEDQANCVDSSNIKVLGDSEWIQVLLSS